MDAIQALTQRVSAPRLMAPAPDEVALHSIRLSALRAADHGNLRPWRFLEITGAGLISLGQLYQDAMSIENPELTDVQKDRYLALPTRAPMILVAICSPVEHAKIPRQEQLLSAGCAVQNMLNAAFALGVGAYWRTGAPAFSRGVAGGLGLAEHEEIVGFLYLGTVVGHLRDAPVLDTEQFFKAWP